MIKRNLGEVKEELRRVAGTAGLKATDVRLVDYINIAQERLISLVKTIPGSIQRVKFVQHGGVIALPNQFQRIISGSVNRHNVPVMGQWYEYMEYGPGQQDGCNPSPAAVFIDHGESPCIRQSTDKPRLVRVYSSVDERVNSVRPTVRILGYDEDGQWIRSQTAGVWADGVALTLNGDLQNNWDTSTQLFSRITQVVKPVTNGQVEVHFYEADYDRTFFAGRYEAKETNPSFRLYHVPAIGNCSDVIVHLLAKLKFNKVVNDSDILLVGSIPALRYAMRAIAKEDCDEYAAAHDLWTLSAKVVTDEAREYFGNANPLINVTSGAPIYGGISPVI